MKAVKKVMICQTEGAIHFGYRCAHKLERAVDWQCEKCKNVDETDSKW